MTGGSGGGRGKGGKEEEERKEEAGGDGRGGGEGTNEPVLSSHAGGDFLLEGQGRGVGRTRKAGPFTSLKNAPPL